MLKRNLFFLFSITLFALASLVLDIFNYNPYEASKAIFINFYISLFISLGGILSLAVFYFKFRKHKDKTVNSFFWPSVRQGALLSVSAVSLLVLRGLSLLDWWVGTSFVIVIILLELFFQTKKVKNNPKAL